jgi:hypothetical protein
VLIVECIPQVYNAALSSDESQCYSMKLELLTNATLVDDAIRFVSEHNKSKHQLNNYQEEEGAEQSMTKNVF